MLSPEQSRAARGWLDWSQDDLAKRANVSLSTVRDFEKGRRTPISNNLDAMRKALEIAGVRFFNGEASAGIEGSIPADSGSRPAERLPEEPEKRRGSAGHE